MKWILIVVWVATTQSYNRPDIQWDGVTMQEFNELKYCQFAGVEAKKIAPKIRVVCVPKGI